jgi:hypothetical protein
MLAYMLGALVATAVPTVTPADPKPVIATPAAKPSAAPDMALMLQMFDKFFPAQPEPDPARLALARTTALALLPPDSLGKGVSDMMGGMFEHVLAMRASDFPGTKLKAPAPGSPGDETFHQSLVAKDPHFDERMRLTRAAVAAEFMRVSALLEPRLRDGLSRAVARRFDQRQLADINAFFATDSGRALGNHFLGLWFDPDLMRSMMAAMPDMMVAMPGAMARIEAATAHLPKPPKPAKRSPAPRQKSSRH